MIDYSLITNETHAKAIWLIANTKLTNKRIGRMTGLHDSQVGRLNRGQTQRTPHTNRKDMEYYAGLTYPIATDYKGYDRRTMTPEQTEAYVYFTTYTLPQIMEQHRFVEIEEKTLYGGVYEVYQIADPSKNYFGESKLIGPRALQHFKYSSNPKLNEDVDTLGADAFAWRVIERLPDELNTSSYRKEREGYWINNHNPYYNAQPGSRPFFLIDANTLQIVRRCVTVPEANHFIGISSTVDTNFGRLLHGVGISYKGYHAVYEDEYTTDWQPAKDNRLRGNQYA